MSITEKIEWLTEKPVAEAGYDIVRTQFTSGKEPVLQIMIERKDRETLTVEDCATVSRIVADILDVTDPITDAYNLEVSSPGIDRPLTRIEDYERFAGFDLKLETESAVENQKKFKGKIIGLTDDKNAVVIFTKLNREQKEIAIDFANIKKAKLIITDELIDATSKRKL